MDGNILRDMPIDAGVTAWSPNGPTIPLTEALTVVPTSPYEYSGNICEEWSFGPRAHGGYVISLLHMTVKKHFETTLARLNQPDTVALHVEFLRVGQIGDAKLSVKELRIGKATSTIQVTLTQNGEDRAMVIATNTNETKASQGLQVAQRHELADLPHIDFNAIVHNKDRHWVRADNQRVDGRPNLASTNHLWVFPRAPFENERKFAVWLSPSNVDELWTSAGLGIVCDLAPLPADAFLPPIRDTSFSPNACAARALETEKQGTTIQQFSPILGQHYNTLSMTIDVKRQLEPGEKWLLLRGEFKELRNGRFDMVTEVWNPQHEMIAVIQSAWSVAPWLPGVYEMMSTLMTQELSKL